MFRRTLLSTLAVVGTGGAGCLGAFDGQSTVALDVPVCNFAPEERSGEITVTHRSDGSTVLSDSFALAGTGGDDATRTPTAEAYSFELDREETYRFSVALDSGASDSLDWIVHEDESFQIELYAEEIRFRELADASP